MAHGISIKEGLKSLDIKNKMVKNINNLSQEKAKYLVSNLAILIDKSINNNETIDDSNTNKEFISFLIQLYYT
jgi:hypothetical protein